MAKNIRFGEYVQAVTVDSNTISYDKLMPKPRLDKNGKEITSKPEKLKLAGADIANVLKPYFNTRFMEQARAVVPLALFLALFQYIVLQRSVADAALIGGGLVAVMIGLMIFMEGLKLGLMPFGDIIGSSLPKKLPLPGVLTIAFLLGIGCTYAEPAIGTLQVAGSIVDPSKAPYLYTMLNAHAPMTVLLVGLGVGIAAVLGTVRFLYDWSLKPLIFIALAPGVVLTAYCAMDPDLATIVGLAWDCGAVTTGPVTVPLVLALGIGVANSGGKGSGQLSGFGIVTLASIFPVVAVLGLGIYLKFTVPVADILAAAEAAKAAAAAATNPAWHEVSPGLDIVMGVQAIVPLVLFLLVVLFAVLREKLPNAFIIVAGLFMCVLGMCTFNVGLTYGLAALGAQTGSLIPIAFVSLDGQPALYPAAIGMFIAAAFAWLLGYAATMAEPALNALGVTVQNLTNGSFKKSMLMYAVAIGVATGIMLGVTKLIFDYNLLYILVPGYIIALVLTLISSEAFVNVGWDSAGVTTGPVTVPLVLAMGLGFGKAVGALEGFGILAAASIAPIVSVLALGVYVEWKTKRELEKAARGQ
jgi:Protein of unknown function (DUF1538)